MSTQLQFRRGNTSQHNSFTGVAGEVTVDTDQNVVVVHDGFTPGGHAAPTLEYTQAAYDLANATLSYVAVPYGRANNAYAKANAAYDHANSAYGEANSKVNLAGDTMTGNLEVPNLTVTGNLSVNYVLAAEDIEANNIVIDTTLYSGLATRQATPLPNLIAQFTGNTDSYVQVNAQNIDPNGSGDYVVTADVGNDTTFFIDMGMQGSNLTQGALHPLDGYLIVQGNTGQLGGNLVVGTSITGTETHIVAGGLEESNVVAIFTDDLTSTFTGNVVPNSDNTQYLGSTSKRWHSLYVGPGSVDIDNVVLSNNAGVLTISGASDIVLADSTVPPSSEISTYANSAYAQANTGTLIAQAAFDSANNVAPQIQPSFDHANAAYAQANTTAIYANAAYGSGNTTLTYAQAAYAKTNAAFDKANSAYSATSNVSSYAGEIDLYAQSGFAKANSANVLAQASYDEANTKFDSAGGLIDGDVTISGQANVYQRLSVGTGSYTILPNLIAQFTGTSDFYSQINQQNLSGNGSTDIVATADNGTDQSNYVDMGIAGSTYDNTTPNAYPTSYPNDGYLFMVGDAGADFGGNLVIGTAGSGSYGDIAIVQGTGYTETARFVLGQGLVIETGTSSLGTDSGALVVQGGLGVSGNVYAAAVYDNGIELKSYIETANNFLQANDASTLSSSKSYTDSANTSLKSYTDSAISTANNSMKSYVDAANTSIKSYVDNGLSTTLSSAQDYTDTANTNLKSYVDAANTKVISYVNTAVSANLSTAQSYTDTANTKMKSYVDAANNSVVSYVNSVVTSNLSTAETYTDTANTNLKSYVDSNFLLNTGGTITGAVTIAANNDLTVTGNLHVYGNTTTTQISTISVSNSIIYLAQDNPANLVDVGFVGSFTDSHYQHTGFVRNHLTGQWGLFSNVITEPASTVNWSESGIVYDTIVVGGVVSPTATINGIELGAYSAAVYALSNAAYSSGNTTLTYAQAGYALSNTNAVLTQAAYNSGNNTLTYAQAGYAKTNAAFDKANTDVTSISTTAGVYGGSTAIPVIMLAANGRVSSITNTSIYVPPGTAIFANTDQLTANASTGNVVISLATSGVTTGTYGGSTNIPVLNVDQFGRITSASNVAVSTTISLAGGTGTGSVSGGGTLTFTGSTGLTTTVSGSTITLTNTGVTSLTSNSSARITQSATTGAVSFDLATTSVTAGTYSYPSIQVDAYGRTVSISNQTPVTSWNGMTGAVSLSSANVVSALGYTPTNKAGDNFTGAVIATSLTSNTSVSINGIGVATSNTFTTASTDQVSVDAFALASFRSAKYEIQMTSGSSYHVIEMRVLSDGVTALSTQYGEMYTGSSLGTFDVSVAAGIVSLLFTATNAITTVKLIRRTIAT